MKKPYAIIQLKGKQFIVSQGDKFSVDRLDQEPADKITVSEVLLYADDKGEKIGEPILKDAAVELQVQEQMRTKKLRVATYKAKSRSRKVKGHRSHKTIVEVLSIKA